MKLAILTSNLDPKHKEEGFIIDWVQALSKQIDNLVVILVKKPKTSFKLKKTTIYSLPEGSKIRKILYILKILTNENKKKKIDGIFNHIYPFLGVVGGFWGKINSVKTIMWYAGGIGLPKYSLLELALRLNHQVVTCSKTEKQRYEKAYNLNNVTNLGHAINVNRFEISKRLSKNEIIIGSIGRATPNKNFELLIDAVSKIKTDKQLIVKIILARIFENRKYVQKLKTKIKENINNNVHIKIMEGIPFNKIPKFYAELNLYIHPSKMKSIDKTGIEAIISKTPVLLSTYGYMDCFKNYKNILFDPNNSQELQQKIQQAIDLYTSFSSDQENLQKYTKKHFSLESFMKKLVKLYE